MLSLTAIFNKIIVVPAWTAGTQAPGLARLGSIPAIWIPAIHAGMTAYLNGSDAERGNEKQDYLVPPGTK